MNLDVTSRQSASGTIAVSHYLKRVHPSSRLAQVINVDDLWVCTLHAHLAPSEGGNSYGFAG